MSEINNFVKVVIRLQTGGMTKTGFGTTLIVAEHNLFTERIKFIAALSELEDLGANAEGGVLNGLVYNAAKAAFSQNPKPELLAIGRVQVNSALITIPGTVTEGTDYTVKLNGTEYTYTAIGGDDGDDVAAGLVALLNPVDDFTAVVGSTGSYSLTLSVDDAGTAFLLTLGTGLIGESAPTKETYLDALAAIQAASDEFYGVTIASRDPAVQEDVADWIEANDSPKFFRYASADPDIVDLTKTADTTSIIRVLQLKDYDRSSGIYHALADGTINDDFIDVAWSVMALGYDPDVETATDKFKSLKGIVPDVISPTQRLNVIGTEDSPTSGKNGNIYTAVAGQNVTQSGMTASGEWNDIILGADWLKVRIEERIFRVFTTNAKVPYTNAGIAAIVGEIRAQLQRGQSTQFLAFDESLDKVFGFLLSAPKAERVDTVDRANRILKGITFIARAAGAIHAAKPIVGTLVP